MKYQMASMMIVLLMSAGNPQAGHSQIVYVKSDATGANNGTTWSDAYTDLQSALTNASDSGVIWIAEGTYYPGQSNPDTNSFFAIEKALTLYGGFSGTEQSLEERDPLLNPVILSGDLLNNDIPNEFSTNREDNVRHVVIIDSLVPQIHLNGVIISGGHTGENQAGDFYENGGGGILSSSPVRIENCSFYGNFAVWGGSVLLINGASNSVIRDCNFFNNKTPFRGAAVSAVNVEGITIEKSVFSENQTTRGAVYALRCFNFLIDSCLFEDNFNLLSNGGAVFYFNCFNSQVINSQFFRNGASNGGGIVVDGRDLPIDTTTGIQIRNCLFEDNRALNRGAAIYCNANPDVQIFKCEFKNNQGTIGPAINFQLPAFNFSDTADVSIDSCLFYGNSASEEFIGGGAIFLSEAAGRIQGCQFDSNSTTGVNSGGGHMLAYSPGRSIVLRDNIFKQGHSEFVGGAVAALGENTTYTFEKCHFIQNTANASGGAIYQSLGAKGLIHECRFEENKTLDFHGGAIAFENDSASIVVQHSEFYGNVAGGSGGAIGGIGEAIQATIRQCGFFDNESAESGGAIYINESVDKGTAKLIATDSYFGFNEALSEGSAISVVDVNTALANTVICQNHCEGQGIGGTVLLIASHTDTLITNILNSTIADNTGGDAAGIIQFSISGTTPNLMTLQNTILRNKGMVNYSGESGSLMAISRGGNMSDDFSMATFLHGVNDLNNTDPAFTFPDTFDYRLLEQSPAIDAGITEGAPVLDILGNPRINAPDMGAYEYTGPVSIETSIHKKHKQVTVYPNPVEQDKIQGVLSNNWKGMVNFILTDIQGRVVLNQILHKDAEEFRFELKISNLPDGYYYLNLSRDNQTTGASVVLAR